MRYLPPILLSIVLSGILAAPGSVRAQQDTLRVNTRLVQIDVIVRDKNGPVADLKSEDFTILDNGKPQQIEVFSVSDARDKDFFVEDVPLPPGVVTNRPYSGLPVNLTVILFDRLNTALQYQEEAKRQLAAYLKEVRKGDRISLYTLDTQLRVIQDFTADPDYLARAVTGMQTSDMTGADTRTAEEMREAFAVADASISPEFANAMAAVYTSRRAGTTAEALESIARHLAGLPGRKNLVWMSTSFPLSADMILDEIGTSVLMGKESTVDNNSHVRRAARALNEANVAIYPIDIRGLPAPDMNVSEFRRLNNRGGALPPLLPPVVMNQLADATGGRAFYFTNGLTAAVRSAVSDGDVSYTLGFYVPENSDDRSFHKLKIEVSRRGVDVRHRAGYYPAGNPEMTEQQRFEMLADLVGSPLNATQIALMAAAQEDPERAGNYRVRVSIDAVDIRFEEETGMRKGMLNLAFRLESSKTREVRILTVPLNLPESEFIAALRSNLYIDESVAAVPGDRLRVVVQDQATGNAGSLWVPLGDAPQQ